MKGETQMRNLEKDFNFDFEESDIFAVGGNNSTVAVKAEQTKAFRTDVYDTLTYGTRDLQSLLDREERILAHQKRVQAELQRRKRK
jgi:chitinase